MNKNEFVEQTSKVINELLEQAKKCDDPFMTGKLVGKAEMLLEIRRYYL